MSTSTLKNTKTKRTIESCSSIVFTACVRTYLEVLLNDSHPETDADFNNGLITKLIFSTCFVYFNWSVFQSSFTCSHGFQTENIAECQTRLRGPMKTEASMKVWSARIFTPFFQAVQRLPYRIKPVLKAKEQPSCLSTNCSLPIGGCGIFGTATFYGFQQVFNSFTCRLLFLLGKRHIICYRR